MSYRKSIRCPWVSLVLAAGLLTSCQREAPKEKPAETAKPQRWPELKVIEAFEDPVGWEPIMAPGTTLGLGRDAGVEGKALKLKYDLAETKAYVVASKEVDLELPDDFTLLFQMKRTAPENRLEFKLVDAEGNTFMHTWYAFASMNRWRPVTVARDQLKYAWGPNPKAPLKKIKKLEFTVAGTTGSGEVWIDELKLALRKSGGKPVADAAMRRRARLYPRWLSDQQAYWTLVGVPRDDNEALIAEDGTLEPYKRGFSLMPFLYVDSKLVSRDEVKISQSLERGYLPIPTVRWEYGALAMEITTFAHGSPGSSSACARYRVTNSGDREITGKLFLAVHPYQVYPPWQGGGGISFIKNIRYSDGLVDVNHGSRIKLLSKPEGFGCQTETASNPEGNVVDSLVDGKLPSAQEVEDPTGFASGAIAYAFRLAPHESVDYYLDFPLHENSPVPPGFLVEEKIGETFEALRKEVASYWEEATGKITIDIPDVEMVDALRANIAYNLITLDGKAFQPGSRSYDKSWMRDGGSAASALLEMGFDAEPREFIEWFSAFQQPSGEIPPIIDTKEEDPLWEEKQKGLIEYDSQGEFVWVVMQCYRFTRDKAFLEKMFPKVLKALKFLETLRAQRLTDEYRDGPADTRVFYGILPPSTSHEGYHNKHSYWDDFWALRGWRDSREMAEILGRKDVIPWMEKEYKELKEGVYNSMALVMKTKGILFMPGCAELGDFDATSSSVALTYCGEQGNVPKVWLKDTFDRYRDEVVKPRLASNATYRYTPYEMRNVPALIRLGRPDEARTLLKFLFEGRRPSGWNHFAEVVHSDPRFPTYIGDMPHTWVGAEFINAVRSLFLYEAGGRLVLADGVDEDWLSRPDGISVKDMPSWYGKIDYQIVRQGNTLHLQVSGDGTSRPPEGYVWKIPNPARIKSITLNGKEVAASDANEVVFFELPAEITVNYRAEHEIL